MFAKPNHPSPSPRACNQFYSGCGTKGIMSMILPHDCVLANTGIPDVTKSNKDENRVEFLVGNKKRRSLLVALGLGRTSRALASKLNRYKPKESTSPESNGSSDQTYLVNHLNAVPSSLSSSRATACGYPEFDTKKLPSATSAETAHRLETSSETHGTSSKRDQVPHPNESQSNQEKAVFEVLALEGRTVSLAQPRAYDQEKVDKFQVRIRPRPGSVLADRPKSGEHVREFLHDYQSSCIQAPALKPLRLRGTAPTRASSAQDTKSEPTTCEHKSVQPDAFKAIEELWSSKQAPTDLVLDAFVLDGRLVPVSRSGGPRQDVSDNVVPSFGCIKSSRPMVNVNKHALTEPSEAEIVTLAAHPTDGVRSQCPVIPTAFVEPVDGRLSVSSDLGAPISEVGLVVGERSQSQGDDIIDPVDQSQGGIEHATTILTSAFRCDVEEDEDVDYDEDEDDSSRFELAADEDDIDSFCFFEPAFVAAGLLASPAITPASLSSSHESTPPITPTCEDLVPFAECAKFPRFVHSVDMAGVDHTSF